MERENEGGRGRMKGEMWKGERAEVGGHIGERREERERGRKEGE
jgi:hypothetical protein